MHVAYASSRVKSQLFTLTLSTCHQYGKSATHLDRPWIYFPVNQIAYTITNYLIRCEMDFSGPLITSGLRRTTDILGGILEKTSSDVTFAIRQKEPEGKLRYYGNDKEDI